MIMMKTRSNRRLARGMSTAELMAGISLGLIVIAAIYSFQKTQLKAFATQSVYSQSQMVTRSAVDLMARELRMAVFDPNNGLVVNPGNAACAPGAHQGIMTATPTSIRIKQDLNNDGVFTAAGEDITYDLVSGNLRRTDGGNGPVTIVSNVTGFSLRFFSANNPPVELVPAGSPASLTQCQRDTVAKVMITVHGDVPNRNTSTDVDSTVETEVAIRSRAINNI
jgi:type IV pilus assembly protein PilW